jgi:hypothetical protein
MSLYSPDRVTFYTWERPPDGHPAAADPQIRPIIRYEVNPATTTIDVVNGVTAIAQGLAYVEQPEYPLFIQNSTRGRWGFAGFQSGNLDSLTSPSPHVPVPSQASMFSQNNIANARSRMSTWFAAIKDSFDAASIPAPKMLLWDDEEEMGYGYGEEGGAGGFGRPGWTTAYYVGRNDVITSDTGIWRPSLNDPRASSQIVVCGRLNGESDMTLAQWEAARIAAGVTYDTSLYPFSGVNGTFVQWLDRHARWSWAIDQMVYQPGRSVWPGIETANYEDAITSANTRLFFQPANLTGRWRNFGSHHSAVLYSPNLVRLDDAGLRVHPLDDQAEYRTWMASQRDAYQQGQTEQAAEYHKAHVDWYQVPGSVLTDSYVPTLEDVAQSIARNARWYGDSRVALWGNPGEFDWDVILALKNRVNQLTSDLYVFPSNRTNPLSNLFERETGMAATYGSVVVDLTFTPNSTKRVVVRSTSGALTITKWTVSGDATKLDDKKIKLVVKRGGTTFSGGTDVTTTIASYQLASIGDVEVRSEGNASGGSVRLFSEYVNIGGRGGENANYVVPVNECVEFEFVYPSGSTTSSVNIALALTFGN